MFGPYLLFVQDLHGVVVPGLLVLHEHHSPKGAGAKGLDSIKLVQLGCILWTGKGGLRGASLHTSGLGSPLCHRQRGPWGMGGDDPGDILPGRVAGARSGLGLGPRSCWQLHGEQGLPGARVQMGWGPGDEKQGSPWELLGLRCVPEKGSPIFSGNLPWPWLGTLSLRGEREG